MKEISSNGNTQTVDVVFPLHPVLLYFNPGLLKLLLDPLFENQESGHYPNKYAMHDLGAHYPNATGHPDGNDEQVRSLNTREYKKVLTTYLRFRCPSKNAATC
jgi:hypothetical protein